MPKRRTILGCIVAPVSLVLVTSVCGYLYLQNVNYHSGLDAAKAWARLNDFPSTAPNVSVEATGSMFTREFTVTFVAPLEDINSWIDQSPGTKDGTPTIMGSVRKYEIEPGGGAQRAELQVDDRTRTVKIKASWS
jgi:hypothetical protein